MKRAIVIGGVMAVTSVAAFGAVHAGWWTGAPPQKAALSANVPAGAPPAAPQKAMAGGQATTTSAAASAQPQSPPAAAAITVAAAGTPAAAPAVQAAPAAAAPPAAPAAAPSMKPASVKAPACANPNAMGVARVVEIDTTGGPGFGFQHFKSYDFLSDHEVVLTFDDGPWLGHTPAVLKALADQCLQGDVLLDRQACHLLSGNPQAGCRGRPYRRQPHLVACRSAGNRKKSGLDAAKEEFEKGASAVQMMAGVPIAPFFRFPDLRHPPEMLTYLGERNVASFSTDVDSWDFKIKKPEELTKSLMAKLQKAGKGIILMHDFQKVTSIALPQMLGQMQQEGFKVVHMVPKSSSIHCQNTTRRCSRRTSFRRSPASRSTTWSGPSTSKAVAKTSAAGSRAAERPREFIAVNSLPWKSVPARTFPRRSSVFPRKTIILKSKCVVSGLAPCGRTYMTNPHSATRYKFLLILTILRTDITNKWKLRSNMVNVTSRRARFVPGKTSAFMSRFAFHPLPLRTVSSLPPRCRLLLPVLATMIAIAIPAVASAQAIPLPAGSGQARSRAPARHRPVTAAGFLNICCPAAPPSSRRGSLGILPAYAQIAPDADARRAAADPRYDRQIVAYGGGEKPGTVIINTPERLLYLVEQGGRALRYGIGVGRRVLLGPGSKLSP